ncbi:RNA polymerase II elongation factor Ell isoform X1 [Bactrocera dorsalis]|uniref:RNA polymerase II elongation factor Ell isoform X1 n=1 Tax=Bactrocera dorsalis TaxID=27457 RepID=A0ABM3J721_BACDO|nr:RNA polymerase II elongation factor Ell isoform X1 [Bactrocera dorsalis]
MAYQGVANHLKRIYNGRKPTRKIHPINASCNKNQSAISHGNGTNLFLKEKALAGVRNQPEVKTEIEKGKLPDISSRKLRERLVHLLAVNTYTRQEINSIIQKEGLLPCERQTFVHVLKDVAQLSRNVYSLRPNIWKEVDENWPYYNENELQQLKRRKEQSFRAPNSSIALTPESNESPSSSYSTSPPQLVENNHVKGDNSSKRSTVNDDGTQPAKRIRMEHSTVDNCWHSLRPTSPSPITNIYNIDVIEPPVYDFSDYTEITNNEQRQQYKAAFDRYYEEYMPLYQQTTELRSSFRELGGLIIDIPKDCPEYEIINERILAKFQILNSVEQLRRQMRCDYLHDKLEHIKQLVKSYDGKGKKKTATVFAKTVANENELSQQ